ncbi:MAG TPA: sensor histidine kinase [Ilumatobacteraceae bacterium]|nr:sensor histidine kinase [Ilumatobacteraceae bacterium]
MHAVSQQREVISPATHPRRALLGWFDPGEPHITRGPFSRWPRTTDFALAVVVFASSLVAVAASALGDGESFTVDSIGDRPAGAIAMLAGAAVALLWRRRHPVAVAAVVMAIMVGWAIAGYGDGQDLALVVAVYSVGRYTADHRSSLVTVAAVVTVSLLDTIVDTNQRIDIAPAILLGALPWYLGRRVRNRGDYVALLQERAERLQADQLARARQAVVDERSRIARELHDVVAHQVSMMTVQAGAAKTIARDDLDAAVDAMGDVERAGRQALGELRHLLGVLRPDTSDSDDLGPQPGLSGIPDLADELTRTGADVSLTMAPTPTGLSAPVDLSAYRIAQESLTNVIKHAGPHPTVHLTVGLDDDGLVIDIVNTVAPSGRRGAAPGLPESGYGIAGMRERAALLGGTLTAEPQPPNRFRVRAHIPLEMDRT